MIVSFALRASGVGDFNPVKVPGSLFDAIVEVTAGTADYAAGGYAFGLTQLQNITGGAYSAIESVEVVNPWSTPAGTSAYVCVYDNTNKKVQAFGMNAAAGAGNALTEVPNGTAALNGLKCSLRVRFF